MRAHFQVLVLPYCQKNEGVEFCALKRSDAKFWQFVSGGGEDSESPLEAAQRELQEELGVSGGVYKLDSIASIAKTVFPAHVHWPADLYVIPEYSFAVSIDPSQAKLSAEHEEMFWGTFEEVEKILKWDSNRVALWELNQRLMSQG